MIVTENTPRYKDQTVEQSGSLLPEADVIDDNSIGIKITPQQQVIRLDFDTLGYPTRYAYLTPEDAEHLARLLNTYAAAARAW